MNSLVVLLGLQTWKPVLGALLLPPLPFLLLVLVGARLIPPRRGLGWLLVLVGVAGIWLGGCTGLARLLDDRVLRVPAALSAERIAELRAAAKGGTTAIVVLGGGLQPLAPEYGVANLNEISLERLRYGVWLGRQTGLPVAFSGGVGWGAQQGGAGEADIAARIAAQEFGRPLRWTEARSRDTRESAALSVALLGPAGVRHIVLVTNGQHMPRARRAFVDAAYAQAARLTDGAAAQIRIEPAPMSLANNRGDDSLFDWLPTSTGFARVRYALHELIGLAAGS